MKCCIWRVAWYEVVYACGKAWYERPKHQEEPEQDHYVIVVADGPHCRVTFVPLSFVTVVWQARCDRLVCLNTVSMLRHPKKKTRPMPTVGPIFDSTLKDGDQRVACQRIGARWHCESS